MSSTSTQHHVAVAMVAMIQGQEMLIPRLLAMVTAVASMMMLLMVVLIAATLVVVTML